PRTSYSPQVDMVAAPPPTVAEPPPTMSAPNVRMVTGRVSLDPAPPAAGMLRKPAIEIANVEWLPPPSAEVARAQKASRKGRALPWLVGFVLVALAALWIAAPFLVRQALISTAAKQGLVLTIDRVDVARREVRLADVRVESAQLPGIVAHANIATIELRRFIPERVVIDDLDLRLDGSAPSVAQNVETWRAAHDAGMRDMFAGYTQFTVTSGRIEWRDPIGSGSSFTLENATLDVAKNGARLFGDDWHFNSPLVTVRAGAAQAGAWQLDAERSGVLTRGTVRFDPTLTSPASMTWSSSDEGAVALGFNVPIAPLSELHVPAAILGALATDRSRVEAHGEIALVTTAQGGKLARVASGRVVVAAGSLAVFPGGQPVDVSIEMPVAGDPSQPLPITNATLSIAPADPNGVSSTAVASAKLSGKLEVANPSLELAGTSTPIPCVKGTTALAFQLAFGFDKVAQTKLALAPTTACAPRFK
ncbi:MAG TPA: hypothetical protein VIF62_13280, partial [Labilithrix sp.]